MLKEIDRAFVKTCEWSTDGLAELMPRLGHLPGKLFKGLDILLGEVLIRALALLIMVFCLPFAIINWLWTVIASSSLKGDEG